jgi:hypothetical protein
MVIQNIDVPNRTVTVVYGNATRVVSFEENGDVDVEPFDDLTEDEGMELFNKILNNEAVNEAFPFDE